MRASLRRRVAALVAVVAAVVALSGCSIEDSSDKAAGIAPYYAQEVTWSTCGTHLDCAIVTAPRDWDNPRLGSLDLSVVRHHATDGSPIGALFMNPGGPGASGVDALYNGFGRLFGVPLIEQYDLVSWDPRGVGRSTAVHCLDDAALDALLFDVPDSEPGTAESTAEEAAANQRYVDACEVNSGGILPYVSTVQSAHDLDLLRSLLGQQTLNYLGFSYGTVLGATYAGLYPDRVGKMVLDGAVDPAQPEWEAAADQVGAVETALNDFLADCVTQPDCPFPGSVDDARAAVAALLARVEATPIAAGDGRRMGAGGLVLAIRFALYREDYWPDLRHALAEAEAGRAGSAFTFIDQLYGRSGGHYTSNLIDAMEAYACNDRGATSDADQAQYDARVAVVAPTFAPYVSAGGDCSEWPYGATLPTAPITAQGAPPIVVIGTTGDPATPIAAARALAGELSSGVLIVYRGEGHTAYPGSSGCVDDAVDSYFVDGTVPRNGLVCDSTPVPPVS